MWVGRDRVTFGEPARRLRSGEIVGIGGESFFWVEAKKKGAGAAGAPGAAGDGGEREVVEIGLEEEEGGVEGAEDEVVGDGGVGGGDGGVRGGDGDQVMED